MSDAQQITRIIMYFLSGYLANIGIAGEALGYIGAAITAVLSLGWWFFANRAAKS